MNSATIRRILYNLNAGYRTNIINPRFTRNTSLSDKIKTEIRKNSAARKTQQGRIYNNNNNLDSVISNIRQRYRQKQEQTKLNLNSIKNDYYVYINDASVINPFGLDAQVLATIKNETKDCYTQELKAKKLFDWFEENIKYGENKKITGYSTGQEVFRNKEGVCGEMAFLYVTMARGLGLKANYVSVKQDYEKKKVNHACAGVDVERGFILIDPAYDTFDI
ncbi:MAG: transglutaminase-like domain-containing protein, partial [Nanoarchaeota archaeon]|nr:transglutaminase-like domain-containing protein [Nanoarchaeota archaeon]